MVPADFRIAASREDLEALDRRRWRGIPTGSLFFYTLARNSRITRTGETTGCGIYVGGGLVVEMAYPRAKVTTLLDLAGRSSKLMLFGPQGVSSRRAGIIRRKALGYMERRYSVLSKLAYLPYALLQRYLGIWDAPAADRTRLPRPSDLIMSCYKATDLLHGEGKATPEELRSWCSSDSNWRLLIDI